MYNADPREYYNLVSDLKSGRFDEIKTSDTDSITPGDCFSHFSGLFWENSEQIPGRSSNGPIHGH